VKVSIQDPRGEKNNYFLITKSNQTLSLNINEVKTVNISLMSFELGKL